MSYKYSKKEINKKRKEVIEYLGAYDSEIKTLSYEQCELIMLSALDGETDKHNELYDAGQNCESEESEALIKENGQASADSTMWSLV